MKTIERTELKTKLEQGAGVTLLEALPAKYYAAGHLPGANLFPHDEVDTLAPRLLQDKHASIVVYCASHTCQNSHLAAESLERLGYKDVSVYAGGKKDWQAAGLPLER